jgi:hypothetical protein
VAVLPVVARLLLKDKAEAAEKLFGAGVQVAYSVVNDIASRTTNKIDDKVAVGLKVFADYYASHGKTPSQLEEQRAKLLFSAMHGQEKK